MRRIHWAGRYCHDRSGPCWLRVDFEAPSGQANGIRRGAENAPADVVLMDAPCLVSTGYAVAQHESGSDEGNVVAALFWPVVRPCVSRGYATDDRVGVRRDPGGESGRQSRPRDLVRRLSFGTRTARRRVVDAPTFRVPLVAPAGSGVRSEPVQLVLRRRGPSVGQGHDVAVVRDVV